MAEQTNPNPTGAHASGIMFITPDGETLLLRRGEGGDHAGTWAFPAGKIEPGESPEEAARRETREESGYSYEGPLTRIHEDQGFATFLARGVEKFEVTLCEESTGYAWCKPEEAPLPLHPGIDRAFRIAAAHTELDVATLVRDGDLPSPQPFSGSVYFALRITGTGHSYRSAHDEHAWRDPSIYLTPDFLARCNGLPVIWLHTEGPMLDGESLSKQIVGTIMLPYIQGDEVWGIARIIDMDAAKHMASVQLSTSPNAVFAESSGNVKVPLKDDSPLLIEGNPVLIDHLAVCELGVWDKGGPPMGVQVDQLKEVQSMAGETSDDKTGKTELSLNDIMTAISAMADSTSKLHARLDSVEKNMPAPTLNSASDAKKDAEEAEEKEKADKARKDAEEEKVKADAKKDADDKEAEEKAKKDAMDKEDCKADADPEMYADAQAKADSVYQLHSKSAPRPMDGEKLMAYRARLVRAMQPHSKTWAGANLAAIGDAVAFSHAEAAIYADAATASNFIGAASGDGLRAIRRVDPDTGHNVTTYAGRAGAWCADFKAPAQLADGGIILKAKQKGTI
jgi:8-oxo-dGTP pyrophosphatase MutT (NUDIX family)